ncbi:hypothetical protein CMT57_09265 [Elizabethkingia anophelis]|nr:hypothetical protein [Elizabethkingia anophelis]
MKTKYVKVLVSERLPEETVDVIIIDEFGDKGEGFALPDKDWMVYTDNVTGSIEYWLEPVPDHSEEMLSLLEELISLKHLKDTDGKTPYYLERQPKAWEKAKNLINKVKDNGK